MEFFQPDIQTLSELPSQFKMPEAIDFQLYFSFLLYFLIASYLIKGDEAFGQPLPDGKRRVYVLNGLATFVLLIVGLAVLTHLELFSPLLVCDRYFQIFAVVNMWALALSVYLYLFPRKSAATGNVLMDFWVGVELNPELIPGLDLKMWSLRPGMQGWIVLNLCFLYKQWVYYGVVSTPMMLYQLFSFIYVFDYFYNEKRMLSTWDIVSEHFGLMLVWGDYVFIPFAFSVQCFWLYYPATVGMTLPQEYIAATIIIYILGIVIFRLSNNQKDDFKTLGTKAIINGKPPLLIENKLLVSGMWGVVRKPNYLGDLLMALSLGMPCGLANGALPYFYFIYLTILLIHRAHRDNEKCAAKYGLLWKKYTETVKYTIVPYVY